MNRNAEMFFNVVNMPRKAKWRDNYINHETESAATVWIKQWKLIADLLERIIINTTALNLALSVAIKYV